MISVWKELILASEETLCMLVFGRIGCHGWASDVIIQHIGEVFFALECNSHGNGD